MNRSFTAIAALTLIACTPGPLPEVQGPDGAVFRRMTVERLPEMLTPRGGHRTLLLGEELTVIGGHTDGFKLIETAEYLRGGAWHEVPMYYPHDGGFIAPLPDGKVMVGGGSAEPFGIGQTFGVEIYDPATHSSYGTGILDRKRAYASALSLPDGRVIVSGNWYADDGIACHGALQIHSLENRLLDRVRIEEPENEDVLDLPASIRTGGRLVFLCGIPLQVVVDDVACRRDVEACSGGGGIQHEDRRPVDCRELVNDLLPQRRRRGSVDLEHA